MKPVLFIIFLSNIIFAQTNQKQMNLFDHSTILYSNKQNAQQKNKINEKYNKALKFADFLYNSGEFDYASKEYLKLYFFNKNNPIKKNPLKKRIALSAYYAKNYDIAKIYLLKVFKNNKTPEIYKKLFKIYEDKKDYKSALKLSKRLENDSHWFISKYFYLLGQKDSAKTFLKMNQSQKYSINTENILKLMDRDFNKKSYPIGFLTSLFPGGGYLYSDRLGDAVFATSIIIPMAIISAVYYNHGERNKAIVWGSISGVFYLGTIYGGVKSVGLYNEQIKVYKDFEIKKNYEDNKNKWFLK